MKLIVFTWKRAFVALTAAATLCVLAIVFTDRDSSIVHRVFEITMVGLSIATGIVVFPFRREWDREQRRKAGQCVACGYDLRASRDRCPECGAIPEKQ